MFWQIWRQVIKLKKIRNWSYPIEQQSPPIDHIADKANIKRNTDVKDIVSHKYIVFSVSDLWYPLSKASNTLSSFLKYCSYHCFGSVITLTYAIFICVFSRACLSLHLKFLWEMSNFDSFHEQVLFQIYFEINYMHNVMMYHTIH